MTDNDIDAQFRAMADSFIDVANRHCDAAAKENVGMALLYAAARFGAFVVAAHADDLAAYEGDRSKAIQFFTGKYVEMLEENLDDYRRTFSANDRSKDIQ